MHTTEKNTKPQNPTSVAYLGIKDTSNINKQKAYTDGMQDSLPLSSF